MADGSKLRMLGDTPKAVTRRRFIKGVIAGGAAVSSASYLFRSSTVHGAGGAGERLISLNVALQTGTHGNEAGLRSRRMRRLHGPARRCTALFVFGSHTHGTRPESL